MKIVKDLDGNLVEFEAEFIFETYNAIQIKYGDKKYWIPKSQIEDYEQNQKEVRIVIPEWLAYEKELI